MLLLRARAAASLAFVLLLAAPAFAAAPFSRLDPATARLLKTTSALSGMAAAPSSGATLLAVDEQALAQFRAADGGRLLVPDADGATLELELAPYELFEPGAGVTYTDDTGRHPFAADVSLFRGKVVGEEDESWAVVGMSATGVVGMIQRGDRRFTLTPVQDMVGPNAAGVGVHALAPEGSLEEVKSRFECGINANNEAYYSQGARTLQEMQQNFSLTPEASQLNATRLGMKLAVDCDYEIYSVKFGANLTAATTYLQTVLGTVNLIYERDVEATLNLVFLNFWTTSGDPYVAGTTGGALPEFRAYWQANNAAIVTDYRHMISGRSLGGGIAYIDGVCGGGGGPYGVSAIDCIYTYPTVTSTWDVNVVAHELGHNSGSFHTHSCSWALPGGATIDSCETPEGGCASYTNHLPPNKGTIMSYCHLISGVANGIRLEFHPTCVSRMRVVMSGCTTPPNPVPPRNPSATPIATGVRLAWTASTSPNVLRYSVYRSRMPLDVGATFQANSGSSPFDIGGLGLYYYRMKTVRAADSSAFSAEVTATACGYSSAAPVVVGSQPTGITSADLNDDDIQDVVFVTTGGSNLISMLGQGAGGVGNGNFAAPVSVATGTMPACVALLDANADGILDAVVGAQDDLTVRLHLGIGAGGIGTGAFAANSTIATVGFLPTSIAVGDFDEDGLQDLVVAGGTTLAMLRGQGAAGVPNGTFAAPVSITASVGSTRGLLVQDLNADGIADLAVTGSSLRILYGNGTGGRGDGTFALGPNYPTGATPHHIATGDFNADGLTDLVVCNTGASSISWFRGQGAGSVPDGTFLTAVTVTAGQGPNAVQVADFDHDGRPDLGIAGNNSSHSTGILLNQGGAGFETAQLFATGGSNPASVVAQDFNEDGTPDLFACNRISQSVTRQLAGCSGTASTIAVTSPNGGEVWNGGTEHTLTWTKSPGVMTVDVQLSTNGGADWRTLASGLIGTSFSWTATGPTTSQARIRVVDSHVAQFRDDSNADFQLWDESVLAVEDELPQHLAILGAWPNPARDDLTVSLALPTGGERGSLELLDLAGRRVAIRDLSGFAAGRHQVSLLERRAVTPGVYLVRLIRAGEMRSMKVAVVH